MNITWRYSPNSEIFTIILHSVSNDFPAGAKIKFRNGRKFIDSAHLEKDRFKDIEEKLNLKVCILLSDRSHCVRTGSPLTF